MRPLLIGIGALVGCAVGYLLGAMVSCAMVGGNLCGLPGAGTGIPLGLLAGGWVAARASRPDQWPPKS